MQLRQQLKVRKARRFLLRLEGRKVLDRKTEQTLLDTCWTRLFWWESMHSGRAGSTSLVGLGGRMRVARTCPASLWYSYLPSIPNYSNGFGKWSAAKMLKGPRAFFIRKVFFTSTLWDRCYHPCYIVAIVQMRKLRPQEVMCLGRSFSASN